jgi:glyoxylase-like metal-dependent hydrolase (beta-lactamase superfamily II)
MKALMKACLLTVAGLAILGRPADAQIGTVKVTPLGSHDGEFCRFDRAMVFEDPNGTRLLYDAGRTVAGVDDPRLGDIDAVLISHVHGDHLGDRRIPEVNAGECGAPDVSIGTTPNSNGVDIAIAKNAAMILGSEMPRFFAAKVEKLGGDPKSVQLVRFGGNRMVGGVAVTFHHRISRMTILDVSGTG